MDRKKGAIYLWLFWVVVNLLMAICTPIHIDEAYYWMFSQQLDWGFFDHPPMVAVFIYFSDLIFDGLLGVRIISIVAQNLVIFIVWRTIQEMKTKGSADFLSFLVFFLLLPLNHIFGFITTPDVPLLLFGSAFFYFLQRMWRNGRWIDYLLWGVISAALMYSKYHAGLLILLVIISKPKELINFKFIFAGTLALLLYAPHIYWQYVHEYVSFRYHFSERAFIYRSTFPLEYLANLLWIINPFFLPIAWSILKEGWKDHFTRANYFVFVGFILFFFWQSFRVHVQPQWLVLIYIPFLILVFHQKGKNWNLWLKWALWTCIPLFIGLRIFLVFDLLPNSLNIHGNKEYVAMITEHANGKPVMYYGDYKKASIHSWYSDQKYVHSYNGARNRKNQFNLWDKDSLYYNEATYFVGEWSPGEEDHLYDGGYYGKKIIYRPGDNIKAKPLSVAQTRDSLEAYIEYFNPYDFPVVIGRDYHSTIFYLNKNRTVDERHRYVPQAFELAPGGRDTISVFWGKPQNKKVDAFGISVGANKIPGGSLYYTLPLNMK